MDSLRDRGVVLVLVPLLLGSGCYGAQEDLEPLLKAVGSSMELGFCFGVDYIVGYKLVKGDQGSGEQEYKMMLGNYSYESGAVADGRVRVTNHIPTLLGLEISQLSSADSGVYLRECWREQELINHQQFYLYVCQEQSPTAEIVVSSDGSVNLFCNTSSARMPGSSLRWYREVFPNFKTTLLLDTQESPRPIQPEGQDEIQVEDGGAHLRIPASVMKESRNFHCLLFHADECLAFQDIELPESEEPDVKTVFRSVGETVELPCTMRHEGQTNKYWETPLGKVNHTPELAAVEHDMTVTESGGEYSLHIPQLMERHAGDYKCFAPLLVADYALTVCPKHDMSTLSFSDGEELVLRCLTESLSQESIVVQWYRQGNDKEEILVIDSGDQSIPFPDDLQGRTKFSETNFTLTISALSPDDESVYWCVVLEDILFSDEDYPELEESSEDAVDTTEGEPNSKAEGGIEGEDYNAQFEDDKCFSRHEVRLIYRPSSHGRAGSSSGTDTGRGPESATPGPATPGPATPGPDPSSNATLFGVVGGIIGLVVIGALIGIVFKLKAKRTEDTASKVKYSESDGEVAGLAPEKNKP